MGCNTCKQKKGNNITSLTNVNLDDLKQAYEMTSRMSSMNNEKWDFVEDVYFQLFPSQNAFNRNCKDCVIRVVNAIHHEYKRLIVNNDTKTTNGKKRTTKK